MRNNIPNNAIINNLLCYLNPKLPISNNHYVCGSNLALFTSIAEVENCLSSLTNKCKCLGNKENYRKDNNN